MRDNVTAPFSLYFPVVIVTLPPFYWWFLFEVARFNLRRRTGLYCTLWRCLFAPGLPQIVQRMLSISGE